MGPDTRKLLSLDGGGVRGMSTIAILRELMDKLAHERQVEKVHPWQEFDMIGGTSTGGLLAIMLGRLRMTVDECEVAYRELAEKIFTPLRPRANFFARLFDFVNAKAKFSTDILEDCIKNIIQSAREPEDQLLLTQDPDACKTFVAVIRQENSANTVMRSYRHPTMSNDLARHCKTWEAARATSAACTFFDPITVGPYGEKFIDGALGSNNPIRLLDRESKALWPDSDRVFLSIGTGSAPGDSLEGSIGLLAQAIKKIVVETEKTAQAFQQDHDELVAANRYFRYNVTGLQSVPLEDYSARPLVQAETTTYLNTTEIVTQTRKFLAAFRKSDAHPVTGPQRAELDSPHHLSQSANRGAAVAGLQPPPAAPVQIGRSPSPAGGGLSLAEEFQAMEHQGDLNQNLIQAVGRNDIAEVARLLEMGADPDEPGPVSIPARLGNPQETFYGLYSDRILPLYIAAIQKHNEMLHLLLQHGASVNGTSESARSASYGTALHAAIHATNLEGVKALLLAGADPNVSNRDNGTPAQHAITMRHDKILKLLIMAGADVNAKTPYGTIMLDDAASNPVMMRLLLDAGADTANIRNTTTQQAIQRLQ